MSITGYMAAGRHSARAAAKRLHIERTTTSQREKGRGGGALSENGLCFWKLKAHLQGHNTYDKATSPNLSKQFHRLETKHSQMGAILTQTTTKQT